MEIGAIWKLASPWASVVVLVRKKDGSLRFCVDLRKLNARTIKDVYSLPCIEESLDCPSGAQILASLDLKVDIGKLNCQRRVFLLPLLLLDHWDFTSVYAGHLVSQMHLQLFND